MKSLIIVLLVICAVNLHAQSWIASTSPSKYQLNVIKNSSVQITFNRQMSSTSFNSESVKLYGTIQGYFPCTFSYSQSDKKLTINHTKNFLPGENVYAVLTGNIRDTANTAMGKIYSIMFTAQVLRGTGTFVQKSTPVTVGSGPYYCTCADYNNDAKPDIALTNYSYSGSISVLKNTGGFNFLTQTITGAQTPAGIVSGDIDCDGDMDIIATLETLDGVAVYLNNGSGTFTPMPYFLTGIHPTAIAIGFIDDDVYPDIVTASWDVDYPDIRVFKSNGNGTFSLKNVYTVGTRPLCLYIGDIDNDGDNDVGVGIDYSNPRIEFYLNDSHGILTYSSSTLTLDRPYGIAGNDVNGDGFVDLVVSNKYSNSLSVLLNNGYGNFTNYIYPTLGTYPYGVTLNDFNKDGKIDIATAMLNSPNIDVKLNTGGNPLFASYQYSNSFGVSTNLVSSDFDNDDDIDLAVLNNSTNSVSFYKNTDSVSINIEPIGNEVPSEFKLKQNYPNPFNPSTKIRFGIPSSEFSNYTTLKIFNSAGFEVSSIISSNLKPGIYEVLWDAGKWTSGVYYCRLQSGSYTETIKMMLIK